MMREKPWGQATNGLGKLGGAKGSLTYPLSFNAFVGWSAAKAQGTFSKGGVCKTGIAEK